MSIGGMSALGGGIQATGDLISQLAGTAMQAYFNEKQATRQNKFQLYLSNTAYQRAMRDMRDAGLNPILAYQQGGATTPVGARAMISRPDMRQGTAFMSGMTAMQQLRNLVEEENLISSRASREMSESWKANAGAHLLNVQYNTEKQHVRNLALDEDLKRAELQLLRSHVPAATAVGEYYRSWPGRWSKKWEQFRRDMGFEGVGGLLTLPIRRGTQINKTFNYGR